MSNLTPFEIRLELLKMAREMLSEDYHGKCQQISTDWTVKVETAKLHGGQIPDHPSFPPYPAEAEIIAMARRRDNGKYLHARTVRGVKVRFTCFEGPSASI